MHMRWLQINKHTYQKENSLKCIYNDFIFHETSNDGAISRHFRDIHSRNLPYDIDF